jgi:hypothetical protein
LKSNGRSEEEEVGGVVHKYHNYYLMATEGERGGGWGKESHNDTVSQSHCNQHPPHSSSLSEEGQKERRKEDGWMSLDE